MKNFITKYGYGKEAQKKRAHIKEYYLLKLIDEERFKTIPLNLRDILRTHPKSSL
jgi:hypothetical protein